MGSYAVKNICVFCSASNAVDKIYYDDAVEIGALIGTNNFDLVYGGSNFGLMGAVSQSAQKTGAKVTGIIPEKIYYDFINKDGGCCDELIIVNDIRERKAKFDEKSDAIIVLPGGFGTLDEVAEMIDLKSLGYHAKPIVFLNTNRYYDKLFSFFKNIANEKFAREETLNLFHLAQTPKEVFDLLLKYKPSKTPRTPDNIFVKK